MFLLILIPGTLLPCMICYFLLYSTYYLWTIIWNLCQKYFSLEWIFTCFYQETQFIWVFNQAHSLRSPGPPWWGKSKLLIWDKASYFYGISQSFFLSFYGLCFSQWQGKFMFGCQRSGYLLFYHYLENIH